MRRRIAGSRVMNSAMPVPVCFQEPPINSTATRPRATITNHHKRVSPARTCFPAKDEARKFRELWREALDIQRLECACVGRTGVRELRSIATLSVRVRGVEACESC